MGLGWLCPLLPSLISPHLPGPACSADPTTARLGGMSPLCVTSGLHLTHLPCQVGCGFCAAVTAPLYVTCTCEHFPLVLHAVTTVCPRGCCVCVIPAEAAACPATALSLHRFALRRLPVNSTLQPPPPRAVVLRSREPPCVSTWSPVVHPAPVFGHTTCVCLYLVSR